MTRNELPLLDAQVQVSACGTTVWVHGLDGSTVGRFSKRFGMDVHTTAEKQLEGHPQCLHCTHSPPSLEDWLAFVELMAQHHGVVVPPGSIQFPPHNADSRPPLPSSLLAETEPKSGTNV